MIVVQRQVSNISWREQATYDAYFVLDQHAQLDASLKQQSTGRYAAPSGHIILISSQHDFAPTPESCVLSGEVPNTNFMFFFYLIRPRI